MPDPAEKAPMIELEFVEDLAAWRGGLGGSSVIHVNQEELTEHPWGFATSTSRQKIFDELGNRFVTRLSDVADIFVGVQSSADKILFVNPKSASTSSSVIFDDVNGREWAIERAATLPALVDRSLEPYEAQPVPDRVAIWPYTIETTATGRSRAQPMPPDELAVQYPRAAEYLEQHRATLCARHMPDPGAAFYAYGRTQSLTKMESPKIIVRVLSLPLSPQYAWDPDGLVVPGGGSGPYYLIRPKDERFPPEVIIALMSHPVIDALVIAGARSFRGGYAVHSKQSLQRTPVPIFGQAAVDRLTELVRELHNLVVALRTESDSLRSSSMRSRRTWLRARVEQEVAQALGLSQEDLEHFAD